MRQELTEDELYKINKIWDDDISQGGAPEGWSREQFIAKVKDQIYNGLSFKGSLMYLLARVPRPDDPKSAAVQLAETITNEAQRLQAQKIELYRQLKESRKVTSK